MSLLSSPSPNLSPKVSFHGHDRSFVGARRSTSRFSQSSRHSHASSSPAEPTFQHTPTQPTRSPAFPAPTKNTADVGTQYTPEEFPPTAPRRLMGANSNPQPIVDAPMENDGPSQVKKEEPSPNPPPEPALRQDPTPHTPTEHPAPSTGDRSTQSEVDSGADLGSPLKRAKPAKADLKVMPRDYMKCDIRDLGVVIADMLLELVRINDPLPFKNSNLTRFHSRAPPGISVHDYLNRIIVHATPSPPILLAMVYYIDRLCLLYPIFTISSLTVHRYLITAATVGAKGLSDSFWTNSTYSRVGGVSLKELALLELEFLEKMDWKIIPPSDVLVTYYNNLVERSERYRLAKDDEEEKTADQR